MLDILCKGQPREEKMCSTAWNGACTDHEGTQSAQTLHKRKGPMLDAHAYVKEGIISNAEVILMMRQVSLHPVKKSRFNEVWKKAPIQQGRL